MKIKTCELTGPALDWAVAQAEGHRVSLSRNWYQGQAEEPFSMKVSWCRDGMVDSVHWWAGQRFSPSTDWSQGGQIIEKEQINLTFCAGFWRATRDDRPASGEHAEEDGPTVLIAAMRCFASSRLGDEVDVPGEML